MKTPPLDQPGLTELRDRIRLRTGLTFPESRLTDLEAGIRRTMASLGSGDVRAFAQRLETEAAVFDALMGNLTVGETYFFREPAQFEVLRNRVLPELRRNLPEGAKLRVWSAGCASGEEAYSLAILLEEQGLAEQATVLGTDLSRAALQRARAASYGIWSLRGSPGATASPNFERRGDRFQLNTRLRGRVEFRYLNLADDSYPAPDNGTADMDLILCRNVMIYFDAETIRHVAQRFYQALKPNGWLLMGPSDPPLWDCAPFRTRLTDGGVFYQRKESAGEDAQPAPAPIPFAAPFRAEAIAAYPFAAAAEPAPDLPPEEAAASSPVAAKRDLPAVIGDLRLLADSGNSAAAEQAAIAALRQFPLAPELHYLHAIVCAELGRSEAAITSLRRVLYIDPSLALGHFMLASVLLRAGRRDEARRSYQAALSTCSGHAADDLLPLSEGEPVRSLVASVQAQLRSMEAAAGAVR